MALRPDQTRIAALVPAGVRLLEIGCGNGTLLHHLVTEKHIDGRGMEISQQGVNDCVRHGLAVIQGDADTDLTDYPDDAFAWVLLSQTLQATKRPRAVLEQMARIGERLLVSIPNFGHWQVRLQLLLKGRMPVNKHLSFEWYDTPNIHFCTLQDFAALSHEVGLEILDAVFLNAQGNALPPLLCNTPTSPVANIFATQAIFILKKT